MTHSSDPIVETSGLTKRFGRVTALDSLNLQLPAGSACALVGANGAGKSTTFHLLLGSVRPTCGESRVFGIRSDKLREQDYQRLGFVAEGTKLPEWMHTDEFLRYCRGMYPTWDDDFAAKLARILDFPKRARIDGLSRGTKMKLALISSLAYRPSLLLLDEPFAGLDVVVRDELVQALVELMQQEEWTILLASHEAPEIEQLADRIVFLQAGRLVSDDPVDDMLARFRRVRMERSAPSPISAADGWTCLAASESIVTFVDTRFDSEASPPRYRAAVPDCIHYEAHPMSLREILVAQMRSSPSPTPEVLA